ncbi:right-handed parallel beta-helix repeat-containing protein [Clostridium lacusfryxellense]|uniref:right-handed parallel beta-helix repeat-containing protein n=1 Tax=Clostridium lacusfryxellense TaxID=205328 RepID=UPI001C0D2EAA|nr:right-handed parallel beta-helix repeat-containing protein [Clostridium lacusfryxellense]MBU3111425.1 right-handed parallel beta-helix repeat-containing protein [Clostridium lacusfryxellense]
MSFLKNKITIIMMISILIIISIFTFSIINKPKKPAVQDIKKSDVQKYSLDITGKTDTSAGFQKMVDSYPSGSTIELPEGIYTFNNTIKLKDGIKLIGEADVVIKGTGKNTLFNLGNNNSFQGIEFQSCGTALSITHKKGLKVSNCRFTNKIDFAAINYSGATDSLITNSFFYDIRKYGVLIDNDSSNITIDNNKFDNAKVFGGYEKEQISGHVYSLNGSKIKVTNNILKNSGGQGVIFAYNSTTGKGTTDSLASNNQCEGNGQEGATIYGGSKKVTSSNSLIGNTCKNNRFNQIEIWESNNNIVKDNVVEESVAGVGNLGAICLFHTTGTTVTGNKVLSAQNNGIEITAGSYKCIITDNTIQNTNGKNDTNSVQKGNGILLDSNGKSQPQYITIKNNKISSSGESIAKSGIYSTSNTNQNNKIDSNSITGFKIGLHEYARMTIAK